MPGINSPTLHDHLPFAMRTGSQITLVWVRHDTRNTAPWLTPSPKSDLFSATSSDGLAFSIPVQITRETGDVVNVFPALYPRDDGSWWLVWLSTRAGPAKVFELPLTMFGQYPSGVVEDTWLPPGYSHRIAPTPTAREYLGVWVQGAEGVQDIYWRTVVR